MFCTTCEGDSHLCSDLHLHYQYFSSQDLPKVSDIVPHEVKETKCLPLSFLSYTKLIKNCSSLSKVLRVLAIQSFMENILENNSIKTPASSLKLAQVAVLLQPSMMERLRRFVHTDANLKDAFFKLIRTSQAHYKPSSKYFLPIILENGLTVASIRYKEKTAEQVLGVRYLPLVSSQDRQLFKLLFLNSHTITAGPFSLHLNKSRTAARLRQGNFEVINAHAKKLIQLLIENCVKCIKTS